MHWLIQPFAQTPLNQICRVFTLSFKTHSNTHTHAYTRRHTIFSAQRNCSVHQSKVDGHEWESTSVTGEVSERGLCFFFGKQMFVTWQNDDADWRRASASHVLSGKDKADVGLLSHCQQTPWWPITADPLKTSLSAHLYPHLKKKNLSKQSSNFYFFLNKLYNYYSFFNLSFKKEEVLHLSGTPGVLVAIKDLSGVKIYKRTNKLMN